MQIGSTIPHFFSPSSTSPNFMYLFIYLSEIPILHPFFSDFLHSVLISIRVPGSCGASLSLLLAVSAGQAEGSCIPHCLWLRKPLCHKLLEMWESILEKCHYFELLYFFFPAFSVTAGWDKDREPAGRAAVPALLFIKFHRDSCFIWYCIGWWTKG